MNLCDKNGDCKSEMGVKQKQCMFYSDILQPNTYCDFFAWYGGCLSGMAVKDATRDGAEVAHQSHKLIHAGSSPAPATSHEQDNAAGGSGEAIRGFFRFRYPVRIKISWHHFLYRNRFVWTLRFFYYDLFDAKYKPQNGLTRWQMFISDFKFIWR